MTLNYVLKKNIELTHLFSIELSVEGLSTELLHYGTVKLKLV